MIATANNAYFWLDFKFYEISAKFLLDFPDSSSARVNRKNFQYKDNYIDIF